MLGTPIGALVVFCCTSVLLLGRHLHAGYTWVEKVSDRFIETACPPIASEPTFPLCIIYPR